MNSNLDQEKYKNSLRDTIFLACFAFLAMPVLFKIFGYKLTYNDEVHLLSSIISFNLSDIFIINIVKIIFYIVLIYYIVIGIKIFNRKTI